MLSYWQLAALSTLLVLAVTYYLFRRFHSFVVGGMAPRFNRHNLLAFEIPSTQIDSVLFHELWTLRKAYWPSDTPKGYKKIIDANPCQFVLFRDAVDGSLRGTYCKTLKEGETIHGKPYRALYLGNLFFYTYYRGSFKLGVNMLQAFFRHWWSTPRGTECYIVFSAISYKSYIAAAHAYPNLYPTHENYGNPLFEEAKDVASQVMGSLYPDEWNKEEWRLHLKETEFDAAIIREEMLKDPHINFFAKMNPNYREGVTIPGVIHLSLWSLLNTAFSATSRKTSNKPHRAKVIEKRDLSRTYCPVEAEPKKKKLRKTIKKFTSSSGGGDHNMSTSALDGSGGNVQDLSLSESAEKEKHREHKRKTQQQEKELFPDARAWSLPSHSVPASGEDNRYFTGKFDLSSMED